MRNFEAKSLLVALLFGFFIGTAQEKSKSERKAIQKQQQIEQTIALIEKKQFVYKANRAFPIGYRSIELFANPNFITISNDTVVSDLPYFGRVTGSLPYGGSGGLKFQGAANDYRVEKKKKEYVIKTTVRGTDDTYNIQLNIFLNGNANLIINCNNRNSISYSGAIFPIESK